MKKKDEQTFADLGIPFPLFAAPVRFAHRFIGTDQCILCQTDTYCFQSSNIVEYCSGCGAVNGIPTSSRTTHITCHNCHAQIVIPERTQKHSSVCYRCLREGKASITQDTEFGLVTWEQAIAGKTEGMFTVDAPYKAQGFPTTENPDGFQEVYVAQEWLIELTRTPTPSSIQGETWLFHCQRPMVYVGEWLAEDFNQHTSSGDGKTLFMEIVDGAEPKLWDAMWQGKLHDEFAIYVYQCPLSQTYRAHWDMF